MSQKTIFDELEADGLEAVEEMRAAMDTLRQRVANHHRKRVVQFAKFNALGNVIFQEVLEEVKQRMSR